MLSNTNYEAIRTPSLQDLNQHISLLEEKMEKLNNLLPSQLKILENLKYKLNEARMRVVEKELIKSQEEQEAIVAKDTLKKLIKASKEREQLTKNFLVKRDEELKKAGEMEEKQTMYKLAQESYVGLQAQASISKAALQTASQLSEQASASRNNAVKELSRIEQEISSRLAILEVEIAKMCYSDTLDNISRPKDILKEAVFEGLLQCAVIGDCEEAKAIKTKETTQLNEKLNQIKQVAEQASDEALRAAENVRSQSAHYSNVKDDVGKGLMKAEEAKNVYTAIQSEFDYAQDASTAAYQILKSAFIELETAEQKALKEELEAQVAMQQYNIANNNSNSLFEQYIDERKAYSNLKKEFEVVNNEYEIALDNAYELIHSQYDKTLYNVGYTAVMVEDML